MLAADYGGRSGARAMGVYNLAGYTAGAISAVAQGGLAPLGLDRVGSASFAVLVPLGAAGALLATRLGPGVEPDPAVRAALERPAARIAALGPSRRRVYGLAGLFAIDAGGGGLVTTTFLSYYLTTRYGGGAVRARCALRRGHRAAGLQRAARATRRRPDRLDRDHGRHPPAQQSAADRGRVRAEARVGVGPPARPQPALQRGRPDTPGPGAGRRDTGGADECRGHDERGPLCRAPSRALLAGQLQQLALGARWRCRDWSRPATTCRCGSGAPGTGSRPPSLE